MGADNIRELEHREKRTQKEREKGVELMIVCERKTKTENKQRKWAKTVEQIYNINLEFVQY